MGDTAETPGGAFLADKAVGVDLGVLLDVFDLLNVSHCELIHGQASYVRVVAEEGKAGGIELGREALENRLELVVRLVGEVLKSVIEERKSASFLELDDVVVGNQVGATSKQGSRLSTLGQGAGRSKGDESEKNRGLHFKNESREAVFEGEDVRVGEETELLIRGRPALFMFSELKPSSPLLLLLMIDLPKYD